MRDINEELLERLTLTGWLLIVVNAAAFCVLGPFLLFKICPAILEAGGRTTRYAVCGTVMALAYPSFLLSKWLAEKCGITVLRPAPPASPCSDPKRLKKS